MSYLFIATTGEDSYAVVDEFRDAVYFEGTREACEAFLSDLNT